MAEPKPPTTEDLLDVLRHQADNEGKARFEARFGALLRPEEVEES